jgi:predicted nuclease with RNAse H fold
VKWFGIDYGSKLAGTTAVSFLDGNNLIIVQSKKKQDADLMIEELVEKHQPEHLFIDVPLSLPGVYKDDAAYHDYFYRACDRTLGAMSPMFLAGLTARGIKICADFRKKGIESYETYPTALAKYLGIEEWEHVFSATKKTFSQLTIQQPKSKHQADSLLCFLAGHRYQQGISKIVGNEKEGLIYL